MIDEVLEKVAFGMKNEVGLMDAKGDVCPDAAVGARLEEDEYGPEESSKV